MVRLILDSLRVWVERTGIDGFRFDLATTLARRDNGFDPAAPLLAAIEQDPLLRGLILIAEPWDVGMGGYQLGGFPAGWGEWNDRYRDTIRRFFRGDGGMIGELATRIAGSGDIFTPRHRPLSRSVNFVAAHDGFTLADLVAYERKENRANGEDNRDGTDDNKSWNNGVEGATTDPVLMERRRADVRALFAALLLSHGTPMISMGDELGRSQSGNNNAYAQDSPIAWLDWAKADAAMLDFAKAAVALRAGHPALRDPRPLTGLPRDDLDAPDVAWFGADGRSIEDAGWSDADNHTLVAVFAGRSPEGARERLCLILHGGTGPIELTLPPGFRKGWRCLLDSFAPDQARTPASAVDIAPRSVMLLLAGAWE